MRFKKSRLIEVKQAKRFKLYKARKLWLVAGVTACSILGGAALTIQQVHADNLTAVVASKSASSVKVGPATSTASQVSSTQTSTATSVASQTSSAQTSIATSAASQASSVQSSTATSAASQASGVKTSTATSAASQASSVKSSTVTSAASQVSSVKSSTVTSAASQASSTQTSKVARVVSQAQKVIKLASSITIKNVRSTVATTDVWTIGDATRPRVDVVDVSSYQSAMTQADYNKLKVAGVKTVIIKATEGTTYTNQAAVNQASMANAAGLNVDFYHYATFNNSTAAQAEAENMASFLTNNNVSTRVLLFADMEDATTYSVNATANLNAFWDILNSSGYTNHGVYTSNTYLYRDAVIKTVGQSRVWRAQYPYTPSKNNLWNTADGAWQFSSTALLPSGADYTGFIDVSIDYNGLTEDSAGTATFTDNNHKIINQYREIGNKFYYYGSDGQLITGLRHYSNGKLEYYGVDHVQYRNRYATVNNQLYYFGSNGDAITGLRYYGNGKLEYYGVDHVQYRNRYATVNNQLYYFGSNGDAITGLRYYGNGKLEYYGVDHVQYRNRYVTVNNQLYYFGSNGDAITGLRYYGNGKLEYYGVDYVQYRNRYLIVNNQLYYFGSNGDAITGLRHYGNGKLEYYGVDYVQYRNRYLTVNNQLYYFGSNGDAITGLRHYGNGKLEYYGVDHVQYRNRYVTVNNQLYYFGSNGDGWLVKK
ncbi:muramidase (plasmid) [Lactiplantibacillus plantarum]|uniref:GH25 family lysozyme n=1 Tax=Lactiplantibacillus plantarum TaxID=1590 RepID=UPI000FF8EE2F|nr:GH25 family lysozyme [Lactiplantibacillus plantarum]QAR77662.1 muramidase [Lactiplantibacillus plantarum]QAS31394.1 muramidase [Lactiplantibacillus plantarum]